MTNAILENFPKGHRFGFFPAGSLGWILSNEAFLKGNPILNYLKLRASYGVVGNDNIGGIRYMFDQYYDGYGYHLGNSNNVQDGLVQGKLANPDVTWEKEKKFNVGFEATLINKIDVSFDYFIQKRSNILSQPYRTVPDYLGISRPDINIGKVDNKGLETSIRYNGIGKKDLTYFVETSLWYAKNKVVYNAEAIQENEYLYGTGRIVGQPFVLEARGFFKDEDDILKSPTQTFTDVRPGDIKYKDVNGDGIIDANDKTAIGYSTTAPEIYYSFHLGAEWKGIGVDVMFQGTGNYSAVLNTKSMFWPLINNTTLSTHYYENRWTPENQNAKYPRLSSQSNANNYQANTVWLADRSFLKLRNAEVYYRFPEEWMKKTKILGSAKLYVRGTDLFCSDHIDVADPECYGVATPLNKSVVVGVTIGF